MACSWGKWQADTVGDSSQKPSADAARDDGAKLALALYLLNKMKACATAYRHLAWRPHGFIHTAFNATAPQGIKLTEKLETPFGWFTLDKIGSANLVWYKSTLITVPPKTDLKTGDARTSYVQLHLVLLHHKRLANFVQSPISDAQISHRLHAY
jgi:hypothetical protein